MTLYAWLPEMEARRQLRELATSPAQVSAGTLYDLVRLSTGDERLAAKERAQYLLTQMRAGGKPEV